MTFLLRSAVNTYGLSNVAKYIQITAPHSTHNYGCGVSQSPYEILNEQRNHLVGFSSGNADFTFKFLNKNVTITKYAIKIPPNLESGCYWAFLIKWKLYGSSNAQNWIEIDSQNSATALKEREVMHWFKLKKPERFSSFRLLSSEKDKAGKYIGISQIEFFGAYQIATQQYQIKTLTKIYNLLMNLIIIKSN